MPLKPETTAWVVTITTFVVFCLSCAGIVFGTNWYLRNATDARTATVSPIEGTVTIWDPVKQANVSLRGQDARLEEGFIVSTDENSRALVTLFDNSTIEVFRDSVLKISKLRVSRFDILAPRSNAIVLEQTRGTLRIGVARPLTAKTDFTMRVPQGTMSLAEGSYIVSADNSLAELRVRDRGSARVTVLDQVRLLHEQQRVEIASGQPPSELLPAAQELISNGDFRDGLKNWSVDLERNILFQRGEDVLGSVTAGSENGQGVVRFYRSGSGGFHAEPTISQAINRDLSEFSVVRLSIRLKVLYQSLSGGGYLGSEYPLLVKLTYGTEGGSENFYVRGFYYQSPDKNNLVINAQQEPQNQWIEFTLDNLMSIEPTPRYLKSIEITASGWDFESMVSSVSLVAE